MSGLMHNMLLHDMCCDLSLMQTMIGKARVLLAAGDTSNTRFRIRALVTEPGYV
jgi:hypothetical protein